MCPVKKFKTRIFDAAIPIKNWQLVTLIVLYSYIINVWIGASDMHGSGDSAHHADSWPVGMIWVARAPSIRWISAWRHQGASFSSTMILLYSIAPILWKLTNPLICIRIPFMYAELNETLNENRVELYVTLPYYVHRCILYNVSNFNS